MAANALAIDRFAMMDDAECDDRIAAAKEKLGDRLVIARLGGWVIE